MKLSEHTTGLLYTTGAFLVWGLSPIFWKTVAHLPAGETLANRVVFCALLLVPVLTWQKRWRGLPAVLSRGSTLAALCGSTFFIACNWFLYIWAINTERILEASLGYYINPLVSVLLGIFFLGERLRRAQWIAVALAAVAVSILSVQVGHLPWVSLVLAFSFGFYGLLRKRVAASPEEGLTFETWLLTPVALFYLARLEPSGGAFLAGDWGIRWLLVGTGLITALPLIWFTHGARRLPLSTVGLLQYLAPTLQFILAVVLYREPFTAVHLLTFVLIWTALAIYTWDLRRAFRERRRESGLNRDPLPAAAQPRPSASDRG